MAVVESPWTFRKLRPGQEDTEAGVAATTTTKGGTASWVIWAGLGMMATFLIVSSIGLAASLGVFNPSPQPPSPLPPFAPPSPPPPYNSDDATPQCNNDCTGCAVNGGCTYSYGAGGAQHDSRAYTSNGECDDGGSGSEHSYCEIGSDCTDCGPRSV